MRAFLISLLCACVIWFIHSLSLEYSDIVSVPVIARSNIPGRSELSESEVSIAARCNLSGYQIFRIRSISEQNPVPVFFDVSDLVYQGGDVFTIGQDALTSYVRPIFGEDARLESFVTKSVQFRFKEENSKKVPVLPSQLITYRPQYMPSGKIQMSPDSVEIFGDPGILANIESVETDMIMYDNVKNSIHGVISLKCPTGVRLSQKEVEYSLEVSRYVEIKTQMKIETRNAPAGLTVSVFPSSVDVAFRCIFPLVADPLKTAALYIDYEDFKKSLDGRCIPVVDGLPAGVIDYSMSPEIIDCFEEKK